MLQSYESLVTPAVIAASVGLLFFFVRGYFMQMQKAIVKLEGQIETMRRDLHDTREQMIKLTGETKALWRFADNYKQRASDGG